MARSFNGTTDQIATAAITNLGGTATASCAIWINPRTLSNAYNGVMYNGTTSPGNEALQILIKSTGKLAYYVSGASGTPSVDPGSATASGWTHVGMSYDSTAGLKTYANGVSDGTAVAHGAFNTLVSPFMGWGYDPGTAGRHLPGSLAEAGLWNVVLTTAEFAALAKGARVNTIRPASLIGYWPLDGLQSPEPDLSGLAHNGTLTGTAFAAGPPLMQFTPRGPSMPAPIFLGTGVSGARSFNGTTDIISAALATNALTNFSMAVWVYPTNLVGNEVFFYNGNSASNGYGLFSPTATPTHLNLLLGGVIAFDTTLVLTNNAWQHIAFTKGATNTSWTPYRNGVAGSTILNNSAVTPTSGTFIGAASGPTNPTAGRAADAAIWTTVLTAAEILALFNGARPATVRPANLVGYWPLDGLQSPEPDLSGKAHNGTLTGTLPAPGPPAMPFTRRMPRSIDQIFVGTGTSGARSFNGSTQSASVVQDLSSVNKLTLSFWLWVNAFDNGDELALEYTANGGTTAGGFYVDPNSGAVPGKFEILLRSTGAAFARVSFTRPSAAAWHQYVILMDNSVTVTNVPFVYVDGTSVSLTVNTAGSAGPLNFANSTLFAMARNNASLFLAGRMADLAVYGGYLMTAGEAKALGTGAARPFQVGKSASLFRWWPTEGLVSPEQQAGPAGLNLTLTAAPAPISGPPMTAFTPRWPRNFDPAVAAPTFLPAFARHRNIVEGGRAS